MADDLEDLQRARTKYDAARARLFELIREKLAAGHGPSAIARASGFTREYIAKIRDGRAGGDHSAR